LFIEGDGSFRLMLTITKCPFTAKAKEPKRFQYKIVEVLPDT